MPLVDLHGNPLDSKTGEPEQGPGLDMSNPTVTMDVLGLLGRQFYTTAYQFNQLAGPKNERHQKVLCADISNLARQAAAVVDFASNVLSEMTFGMLESEERIRVIKKMNADVIYTAVDVTEEIAACKQKVEDADIEIGAQWHNRRMMFVNRIPALVRLQQSLGKALLEVCAGPAPTKEDFDRVVAETKAAIEASGGDIAKPEAPKTDGADVTAAAVA